MRILLTGRNGQVGWELERSLQSLGRVIALARADCDLADLDALRKTLDRSQPYLIVNPAAHTAVDKAESEAELAFRLNAEAPAVMADWAKRHGAAFVHFSTDYVFDGSAGRPYSEDDPTHPLGAYAVSKLAGELYARAYLDRALVVRTSGVFGLGALKTPRGNFIELMLRLAREGKPIRVVEDHVGSPTYAPLLAARTADLVERDVFGLVHCAGGTPISWFDFAKLVFHAAGLQPDLRPTTDREYRTPANRPKYSALANNRLLSLNLEPMPPLEVALRSYLQLRSRVARPA